MIDVQSVTITLPVPPLELSKNGRVHHMDRHRLYQEHKMIAVSEINRQLWSTHEPHTGPVRIIAGWYAPRRPYPDTDNAIERLAAYRDAAQATGLITDDRQVTDTQIDFDTDKANPRVVLTFVLERSA